MTEQASPRRGSEQTRGLPLCEVSPVCRSVDASPASWGRWPRAGLTLSSQDGAMTSVHLPHNHTAQLCSQTDPPLPGRPLGRPREVLHFWRVPSVHSPPKPPETTFAMSKPLELQAECLHISSHEPAARPLGSLWPHREGAPSQPSAIPATSAASEHSPQDSRSSRPPPSRWLSWEMDGYLLFGFLCYTWGTLAAAGWLGAPGPLATRFRQPLQKKHLSTIF